MNEGAQLLPAVCPHDAVEGERHIFAMLRDDPGAKGWVVLHSLDLARHVIQTSGEADFVVFIPDEGVIYLEVKSHHSIRYDGYGWWLGSAPDPEIRGPFRQAADAMHSARGYLADRGMGRSVPMISAVVFPSATFSVSSPEWHDWQVLDRQALHARSIANNFLRIIRQGRLHFQAKGLKWANASACGSQVMDAMAKVLRPRFEILISPSAKRQWLEGNLLQCTEQQFNFFDHTSDNERLVVSGLAGTGKTILALEAVRREKASRPSSSVALFCFNKLLGQSLESKCQTLGSSVKVGHFHQWMATVAQVDPDIAPHPDYWTKTLPEKVLDILTDPAMASGFVDFLVLDEAQDLFIEPYLQIFDLLLRGGFSSGRWMIFGDFERQNLYLKTGVSKKDFITGKAQQKCAALRLDENCRNTPEISTTMTALAALKPGYSKVLRADSRHDPELKSYENEAQQVTLVVQAMDQILGEGFRQQDILLLSPFRERSLARKLLNHPIWKGRLKTYSPNSGFAGYCTVHAFKGLEAPVILLTDIENLDESSYVDLFYVGMSRALHRLFIFAHTSANSALIRGLK